MANYRTLLIGCGARATEHAAVYRDIPNMDLVACCDLRPERVELFQKDYGIPQGFTDAEEALDKIRPDVVHFVTHPAHRTWEANLAASFGVKAAIIEKPMAVLPSDIIGLDEVNKRTGMEIIVNTQRRYFPQFRDGVIRDIVQNKLGDVYFVRASTKGNSMSMGPHMMDLLLLFLGEAQPESVWAMGYEIWEPTEGKPDYRDTHKSPEHLFAEYWFPNDIRVMFDCSRDCLGTPGPGETSFWMHLHFDFLGSKGRLYLTQNAGYWYQNDGMATPLHGESSWDNQGWKGQRDFTAAVADHLDGKKLHLNRFEVGKAGFNALIGAQQSIYENRRIHFPNTFTDDQWHALRARLLAEQNERGGPDPA
ncbi:MAG: Gfo/Idh/MocA family oxidoreductase [Armatimonadia bacterium]